MSNIKELIKELRNKLDKWAKEYYENDKPSVSDLEYDAAYNKLVELETDNPSLITPNSITQRVGGKIDNRFKKETHKFPMLSLSNAFNEEDLIKFDKRIKDLLGLNSDIEYIVEYKIDGLSISVSYKGGQLYKAVTRGDGVVGEDVTHNVLTISDIPSSILFNGDLEVRGEIYMSNQVFDDLNKNGENFSNPRNAAAGSIRQLDSKIAKSRKLNSFMYSIPNSLDLGLSTHSDVLKFVEKNGIVINKSFRVAKNINKVIDIINSVTTERDKLGYEIDGIVVKVNDISKWGDIGFTSKFPKFMIAYKFPEEKVQTTLEGIFPTIGRTGRVTYNAKLAPVRLAGSTVQAATLHNADYIRDININVGDIVNVKKAGDIIPKVLSVAKKKNKEIWVEAKICPSCNEKFVRYEGEVDQYCVNSECPQRNIAKLEHFVSRNAMDIEGLSIETIKTFIENGLITDIPSIYELNNKFEKILTLPGFKSKSVNKLISSIERSKTQDIDKFIFGLGIRHIGAKTAKTIAKRFGTLEEIMKATKEQLISIRDLGDSVADSLTKYFENKNNVNMINKMLLLGLRVSETAKPKSSILEGKTFVITGTLSKGRNHFKDLIESNNGNVSSSVTSKTTYLLAGENAGSKLEKAKKLDIQIINEDGVNELLRRNNG